MKKFLPVLLAAALLVTMFAFPVSADSSVTEFEDFGSTFIVLWDWILKDGSTIKSDPVTFLEDFGAVGGPAESVGVQGWAATTSMDFTAFGYVIDDGAPVIDEEFKKTPEDAVVAAAASAGCSYASRYKITVDTTAIEGNHTIDFVAQFEDGTIVKMITNAGVPVSFEYSADGSAVNATPEPTATPDPSELDNAPGPILLFDNEDDYANFFGTQRNSIEDIYFDDERGCYIISMGKVGDPWVVLMFTALELDGEMFELDTEKYKILQIGARIDPAAGDRGQFYFQTDENTGYDEPKDVLFDYENTSEKQYVNVNLGKNKKWTGLMSDCRLDPFSGSSVECEYELYYMAFFTNENAAKEFGDKWLAEGSITVPTSEPTPTKAPTEVPTATPEVTPTEKPVETQAPATEAKTDAPVATEKAVEPTENKTDDNKPSGPNVGLIIGIVVGVVAIAAIVTGVLISKKKKK